MSTIAHSTVAHDEKEVWPYLSQVIDPEIGCNIVDLGLVYGVTVDGDKVTVQMTLTTQGCPMHESIARGVQMSVLNLPWVEFVEVELVWDPPWDPGMMTDEGKQFIQYRG